MLPLPQDSELAATRRLLKLTSILDVAKAMAAARELDVLLSLVTYEAAKVVDADRCTLFLFDADRKALWSKVAHGETKTIRVTLGQGIAGTVALTGEVIQITDAYTDPRFHRSVDVGTGYHTTSVLCVPMRDAEGTVVGVLQALNKRSGSFDAEDIELLLALGGQAAGAIENALLHEEISRLFEGFVGASVVAIESRDPSTAGHSGRVASLTVALAESLSHETRGPYAGTRFTAQEVQEIRYASLLHDFGKVGVREHVLVKAEKFYPHELEAVRARFALARKDRELVSVQRRLTRLLQDGQAHWTDIEHEELTRLTLEHAELDQVFEFLLACNRPAVMLADGFEKLQDVTALRFCDEHGHAQPLLTAPEVARLSIPRGSLSPDERLEIESHVTHTFRFLSQIPWTRMLRRVPEIAYAHHERVDGSGYPRAMNAPVIPLESKLMAVSDIYDALTASDRPYKKAVPHPLALDILHQEARAGHVDAEVLRIFVAADIPGRALPQR